MIPVMKQGRITRWGGPTLRAILGGLFREVPMFRAGRVILNEADIVKVVRDGKTKAVTVYSRDSVETTFKDHAEAVWNHLKSEADDITA